MYFKRWLKRANIKLLALFNSYRVAYHIALNTDDTARVAAEYAFVIFRDRLLFLLDAELLM